MAIQNDLKITVNLKLGWFRKSKHSSRIVILGPSIGNQTSAFSGTAYSIKQTNKSIFLDGKWQDAIFNKTLNKVLNP